MPVLMRIALRNLMEHKAKSLIVGIIIAVGVLVMIVGNSFLDVANAGIKKNFTDRFTGDVYVYGKSKLPVSVLFGSMLVDQNAKTPLIDPPQKVFDYLKSRSDIKQFTSQVTAFGMLTLENAEPTGFTVLFGVEPESYFSMFNQIVIDEGHFMKGGEQGIMIPSRRLKRFNEDNKTSLKIGDSILVQGFGTGGFKIRELPIVGTFSFRGEKESKTGQGGGETAGMIAYADVDSVRILSGLTLGRDEAVKVDAATISLLESDSDEDLFGGDEVVQSGSTLKKGDAEKTAREAIASAAEREAGGSGDGVAAAAKAVDSGAWQFSLIKMKNPLMSQRFIFEANQYFQKNDIRAQAGDWKMAAMPFAQFVDVVRVIFLVAILIVAIVAVVIIMNTLTVSVLERTGEIGTMRALGATKSYIWKMFFTETVTISAFFGAVGIALSLLTTVVVNAIGIKAGNAFLSVLFGGEVLKLGINGGAIFGTILIVGFIALIAHIYPVVVALRVQPVRAMQNE